MGDYVPSVVLLTGGAGFIGSHVLCHLVKKYPTYTFVCLDRLDYCANTRNFEEIKDKDNFHFIKGDIQSTDLVNHILVSHKVDTIMHFAAQTHVDNSFGNSMAFTRSNVLGTHTLLESARLNKNSIKRFIHVSTDEVYGESTKEQKGFTESDALNPTNPYAATKVAAEFLVKSYRHSFGLPTIITRGNNVYGPKQFPEKLIPKFINLLAANKPCPLHGDGSNKRSFFYASDVSEAFDIVLHKGVLGETYNIGTNFEISNLEVCHNLLTLFGLQDKKSEFVHHVRDRAFNDFRYHIDTSGLEALGWVQKVHFEEGLKRTKEWYVANADWWGDVRYALAAHPTVNNQVGPSHESPPADDNRPAKRAKA